MRRLLHTCFIQTSVCTRLVSRSSQRRDMRLMSPIRRSHHKSQTQLCFTIVGTSSGVQNAYTTLLQRPNMSLIFHDFKEPKKKIESKIKYLPDQSHWNNLIQCCHLLQKYRVVFWVLGNFQVRFVSV